MDIELELFGILGLIVAIVTVFFTYRGLLQNNKSLSYEVDIQSDLISINQNICKEIQVLLQGSPVEQLSLVTLTLKNDGEATIEKRDFDEDHPLKISFDSGANILSANVAQTSNALLIPDLQIQEDHIIIHPILLNKGDSFQLTTLISNFSGSPDLNGRIAGVTEIKRGIHDPLSALFKKKLKQFASISLLIALPVILLTFLSRGYNFLLDEIILIVFLQITFYLFYKKIDEWSSS